MDTKRIIEKTVAFVRNELEGESSGHDWWHISRVRQNAKKIAIEEKANLFICELAALLHDIADEKLNKSEEIGLKRVAHWLKEAEVDQVSTEHVMEIISTMSFKGGGRQPMKTLEGKVVQDADRLDAMGMIGIARTFAFSGAKGQPIHNPEWLPRIDVNEQNYRSDNNTAINHFYEKLLKLKGLMNTDYGKRMANVRHQRMELFLKGFFDECEGKS